MRRTEAEEGEDEERSFPVGERSRRVCSWVAVVFEARKVERGFVRSIVCDIVGGVEGGRLTLDTVVY